MKIYTVISMLDCSCMHHLFERGWHENDGTAFLLAISVDKSDTSTRVSTCRA